MKLQIYPMNTNKKIESQCIQKYIFPESITILKIHYKENMNINSEIIKCYEEKPDVIAIIFNNTGDIIKNMTIIPRYPLFLDNIFYLMPINIQQLNGFSNELVNKIDIINDFIERIKEVFGVIISYQFTYPPARKINLHSGIKELMYSDYRKDWRVDITPYYMSRYSPVTKVGWFSRDNKLAIKYVMKNYDINRIVELGSFYGNSAKYMAKYDKDMLCFDLFSNFFKSKHSIHNIGPLDTNFFCKYIKFNSFNARLRNYNNVTTVKMDNFESIDWLHKHNIDVDLFYIDFCKNNYKIIIFIDKIFKLYPNAIIIGDDALYLEKALKYIKKKYTLIKLKMCYICMHKRKIVKKEKILNSFNKYIQKENCTDIEKIKTYKIKYKIKYILNMIKDKSHIDKIIEKIKELKINPNTKSYYSAQYGSLYHVLCVRYNDSDPYHKNLYDELIKIYPDTNTKNRLNLTPQDYINHDLSIFM